MSSSHRMALQYVLLFGANGVSLPFAGLWLSAQGFSGFEIGVLLSAPMLGRVVTGPLLAVWADGFRRRRSPIAILGAVAALGYAGAGLTEGILLQGGFWFVGATATAALIPLTDVLTLALARRHGFAFAVPRGCGSAAFIVANVTMGAVLARASVDWVVIWIAVAGGLVSLVASTLLPAEPVTEEGARRSGVERFRGLGALIANPAFMWAVIVLGAAQATHAFYYGFSALVWTAQGLDKAITGALWAFAVVIEIGFMWWLEPWRRRLGIGPWSMIGLASAAGVARWGLMALAPPLWLLWPLQALHALTFAASYLAGVQIVERMAPRGDHTAAQTLYSVMSSGLLIGAATFASGPLYDRFGAAGYVAMAVLAAVAFVGAFALSRPGAIFPRTTA